MIKLKSSKLIFEFPEVHEDATLEVIFKRTLRIPDDDSAYALPPGLGDSPVRLVDDFADNVPDKWLTRGGVMLPMYQSEAMWIQFKSQYPFAVKVAAGKVNAVTGEDWTDEFQKKPQDYVVVPGQPWLDGFCVEKGVIRQFVAMPLGAGYSAEEQITGKAEFGGLQIIASPLKAEHHTPPRAIARERKMAGDGVDKASFAGMKGATLGRTFEESATTFSIGEKLEQMAAHDLDAGDRECHLVSDIEQVKAMSLAPGGRMRQKIYDDPHEFAEWDFSHKSRCFIHLANSMTWRQITGEQPPTTPFTALEYTAAGLPWFDLYDEQSKSVEGSETLAGLKSVAALGKEKGDFPLPENESVTPEKVIMLRKGLGKDQVREGRF